YLVGPVVIGRNCDIGPNVSILPSTSIGDNVTISSFSEVKNSVVGNDVNIGAGSIIQDSVIDEGCAIKGHLVACSGEAEVKINGEYYKVNVGAMLGVGCDLKACVVAQPGVVVGNYCQINSMKLISGRLPDKSLIF
ncbi:MAG: NDP-sugar synthase, partial [Chloroflexi bacterium]|nr:NDP-sugar synthase [Chloroflexota bacterium]